MYIYICIYIYIYVLTPPGAFAEAHSVGARVAPDVSIEDCVQFLVQQVQGLHARTDTQQSILVHHLQCAQQQQAQAIHQTQLIGGQQTYTATERGG